MKLTRPIVCFDIEATGVDMQKDRIISLHAEKIDDLEFGPREFLPILCNPGMPIPPDSTEVHGITDADVAAMPPFGTFAHPVHEFFAGCDLMGFGLLHFDIPILWEEFYRAQITWDLAGVRVIDVGNIFKKKEQRTLEAAVLFYCQRDHGGAHDARADVEATRDVLLAQLDRYSDLGKLSLEELAKFSRMRDDVDLAGIITRDKEGRPCYGIKRKRNVPVLEDPGYAEWMLRSDFPAETKIRLREILELQPQLI